MKGKHLQDRTLKVKRGANFCLHGGKIKLLYLEALMGMLDGVRSMETGPGPAH